MANAVEFEVIDVRESNSVTHRGILIQSSSANSSTDWRQGDPPLVG